MRRKEAVKMSFFKWIRSLSVIKQICVGMATVLAVGGSATTVAVVANHSPQNNQVVVSSQSTEESSFVEEPKSEEEKIEEAIHYSSMKISASSIEKDLDIFFLDENNKKIKGQPFSVKLVAVNDAAKLNTYVETITKLNKEIKEAEDIVSGSTAPNAAASKPAASKPAASKPAASSSAVSSAAPSSSASTGLPVEDARLEAQKKLADLGKKKVEAIDAYKEALKNIKGTLYTDDNQDGRITQKKLAAGDFSLCYVPTGDYDAAEFTQKTTVKDKIEYKPVVNIEEKKVTVEEAGDAQPVHEVVEESKSADTVEYVEPNKPDAERVKESKANPINAIGGTSTPGEGFTYDGGAVIWNYDGKNTAEIGISANTGSTITGVESLTEGLDVKYKNGKIIARANNVAGDAGGPIDAKIRVTYSTTRVNDPSISAPEDSGEGGQQGSNNEGQGGEGGQTDPDKKDETPSSSETKKDETPASSEVKKNETTEPAPTTTVVEKTKDIVIVVHGYNEQLKDSQGRLLFRDKNGTPATVGDYDPDETYYYVDESVQVKYQGWQTINGIQYYFDKNGKKVTGPQVILGVRYNFGTDGALLSSGVGVDVSKWQGDINWSEAKAAVSFAIIRAGFRGTSGGLAEDPYAVTNIKGCNANGIRCGLYFYSRATTEAEAVEEASLAIAIAKKGSISLPIYFDMESPENKSAEDKDALVMAFCKTVQAAGYSAGLYASKNWINNYLNPSTYGGISIWVAQYADSCSYGGHYDMWQYTSKGSVPGINTNVDMNESHF